MRNMFVCDLCHAFVKEVHWSDQAKELSLSVYVSAQNPMGRLCGNYQRAEITFKEVCDACRRAVAEQIASALESRIALRSKGGRDACAPCRSGCGGLGMGCRSEELRRNSAL